MEMETMDLAHAGIDAVVLLLMVHSVSPDARRKVESMLTDNAFHIDVKPDATSANRSVEILNAYLKTMGLRLVFKKHFKTKRKAVRKIAISTFRIKEKAVFKVHPDENFDYEAFYSNQKRIEDLRKNHAITRIAIRHINVSDEENN